MILGSFWFGVNEFGRFSFDFGTLSNANDYATHLIVVLPFVLLTALNSTTTPARIVAVAVAFVGIFLIVRTGSRAGFLSLAMVLLFLFLRGTPAQRVGFGLITVMLIAVTVVALPRSTLLRYMMIVDSSVEEEAAGNRDLQRAVGSNEGRKTLLLDSLALTATHPLFGVGPGNFAPSDADRASQAGKPGMWLLTHNTYTEISAETGVPGFILFIGTLVSTYRLLRSTYKRSRNRTEYRAIHNAAFCMMLSLMGFCICIFFASMSYRFYFPALVGLTVSFAAAAQNEMNRTPASVAVTGSQSSAPRRGPA